jgi:F-type H+-transporting ATPase subunit epsilon
MHCQLRSSERTLFNGEATLVVAHSPEGEFAVMSGHAPLLAALDTAPLRIKTSDGEHVFAILSGALRVSADGVTILAQEAIPREEIDLATVKDRRSKIEQELAEAKEKGLLQRELALLAVEERVVERHV